MSINVNYYPLASENGLFNLLEDSTRGHWLSQDKNLEYYDVKSGDTLLYTSKYRPLRIKTLDGSVKTLLVDESQTIAEITKVVCDKIGQFLCTLVPIFFSYN